MEKPKAAVDYNSRMGRADLNDANLTSYCTTRKRQKKKKLSKAITMEFQVKLVENLIKNVT